MISQEERVQQQKKKKKDVGTVTQLFNPCYNIISWYRKIERMKGLRDQRIKGSMDQKESRDLYRNLRADSTDTLHAGIEAVIRVRAASAIRSIAIPLSGETRKAARGRGRGASRGRASRGGGDPVIIAADALHAGIVAVIRVRAASTVRSIAILLSGETRDAGGGGSGRASGGSGRANRGGRTNRGGRANRGGGAVVIKADTLQAGIEAVIRVRAAGTVRSLAISLSRVTRGTGLTLEQLSNVLGDSWSILSNSNGTGTDIAGNQNQGSEK